MRARVSIIVLHMFTLMGPHGPSGFMRPNGAFVHMGPIGPHEPLGVERIGIERIGLEHCLDEPYRVLCLLVA